MSRGCPTARPCPCAAACLAPSRLLWLPSQLAFSWPSGRLPRLRHPSFAGLGPRPSCPRRRLRHPRLPSSCPWPSPPSSLLPGRRCGRPESGQPWLAAPVTSLMVMRPPEPVPSTSEMSTPRSSALRSAAEVARRWPHHTLLLTGFPGRVRLAYHRLLRDLATLGQGLLDDAAVPVSHAPNRPSGLVGGLA